MRRELAQRAVVMACLLATPVHAKQDPRPATRAARPAIDSVFAQFTASTPGCAVGVYNDGAVTYARGYGMASLEHDAPITPKTVFYVGSISKQFTAMAAALAMQQGALAYDDPIRKYLPELPPYADAIKVRHLIHHTSGLRDYNTLLAIAGRRDEDAWNNAIVLKMTARQKGLNFEPGAEYLYSNTGYTLLATIVERATNTPFADFADAKIFKPLGMTSTHYHVDARRLVRGRALGYGGGGPWTLDTPINERAGAGGVYTTVEDLQKWDENFYSGQVGGPDVLKQIQTRGVLNGGTTLSYAWGLEMAEYRGLPIVEHSGALGGYRADIIRFPGQHTSVAVLCNMSSAVPSMLARRVADTVLVSRLTAPAAPVPAGVVGSVPSRLPDPLPLDRLREYAGRYDSDELETAFEIAVKPGTSDLTLKRERDTSSQTLTPRDSADTYAAGPLTLRFQRDASRRVTGFTVDSGRVRGIRFDRR